jgi:O-antigen ligase
MSRLAAARATTPAPLYGAVAAAAALVLGGVLAVRPLLAIVAAAAVVFAALAMRSLPAAVAVWVAAVFVVLGLATTAMQLLIAAAWLGSVIAEPAVLRRVLPGQRLLIGALALLLAWLCLSSLWAKNADVTWQELRWWLVAGGVLVVVGTTLGRPVHVRFILLGFVVGGLLSVVLGWLHGSPGPVAGTDVPASAGAARFQGLEGNPNDLAAQLLVAILFAGALLAESRRWIVRGALGTAIAVLLVGFAATESRGGLVAAGIVVCVAAVVFVRQRRPVLIAFGAAVLVAGAWFALSPSALDRVTSLGDGGAGRSTLWLVAWRIAKDYQPEGVGLNNFRQLAPDYVREPGSLRYVEQIDSAHVVHNTYLQLLAETGLIGLGLFLTVAGACLAAARRAALAFHRLALADLSLISNVVLLAGVAVLSVQLFQSTGFDVRFWVVLGLGPGLLSLARYRAAARLTTVEWAGMPAGPGR